MEKKLSTARVIAGILGILLIIAIGIIIKDHKTITDLEAPAKQNITLKRDVIREDCTSADPASQARCGQDLQELSDLLAQFLKSRQPVATTTPAIQGAVKNIQINSLPKN